MKLEDLSEQKDTLETPGSRELKNEFGLILFDQESGDWCACRSSDGFEKSGRGAPRDIPKGRWVTNLPFEQTRALGAELSGVFLIHDGYFRTPIEEIERGFGIAGQGVDKRAKIVLSIVDRVMKVTISSLAPSVKLLGKSSLRDLMGDLKRGSSLAAGIARVNAPAMRKSLAEDTALLDNYKQVWHHLMIVRGRKAEAPEGMRIFRLEFPRLSYARMLTNDPIPAPSKWQNASRDVDESIDEFYTEILKMKRPVIFRADYQARPGMDTEFAQAAATPMSINSVGDVYRSRFLLEDLAVLAAYYEFSLESALVGEGWLPSATGRLVEQLEAAAGGPGIANTSWSVGLAADNLLASAYRKFKDDPEGCGESVWIAARDREAMFPLIEDLYQFGAMMVSATLGRVKLICPDDPEILGMVLNCAWERGAYVPMDDAMDLRLAGVDLPYDPSQWGGKAVDFPLSSIVHRGGRKALWALDGLQDEAPDERAKKYRIMMG